MSVVEPAEETHVLERRYLKIKCWSELGFLGPYHSQWRQKTTSNPKEGVGGTKFCLLHISSLTLMGL